MATERQVDEWRRKAETNLAQANRLLSALLWAAKELVVLTDMHVADDFAHCAVCKTPWPCPTAIQVHHLAEVFDKAQPTPDGETV